MSEESAAMTDEDVLGRITRAARPLETRELGLRVRERLERGHAPTFFRPGMRPRKLVWAGLGGVAALSVALSLVAVRSLTRSKDLRESGVATPYSASSVDVAPRGVSSVVEDEGDIDSIPPSTPTSPPVDSQARSPRSEAKAPIRAPVLQEDPTTIPVQNLLYQAARALRGSGDPARSLRLLDELGRRAPATASTEEVLALRIEANVKLGSRRAEALAERYLALFPQGKYRRLAESARAGGTGR
jgi:hypothetical protein